MSSLVNKILSFKQTNIITFFYLIFNLYFSFCLICRALLSWMYSPLFKFLRNKMNIKKPYKGHSYIQYKIYADVYKNLLQHIDFVVGKKWC